MRLHLFIHLQKDFRNMKRPTVSCKDDVKNRKYLKNHDSASSSLDDFEEGELGVIESVTVQNFMCHENLTLNFEPHMNFIIGLNGSGKSAILTAIILALGGKSSSTDRYSNIRGFVKCGKNKGKIEVVLRNKGNLAYKPDVYGEKITIIREFSKEGGGSYKIKSESGTICSNQRSELTNILEAMDIMVECPVCVLTQTTSKKFLISKDAKAERLFEFFYKGTGLEILEKKYEEATKRKEEAEAELDKKKESLPDLEKDVKKWKKFLDSSKRISDYKNEMIWAGVIEMEKLVEDEEEKFKKLEEDFEQHKRDMECCKKSFAEKSSELDELNSQKRNSEIEMEQCRKKLEELKAEYENEAASYRRNKGSLQKLENDKKQLEKDKLDLEKCINEQQMKDQQKLEEERNHREKAVKELKDKNKHISSKIANTKHTIETTRSEKSDIIKAIDNYSAEENQHLYELKNIEENLVASKNALRSKVNAFGEHTEEVLKEIQKMQNRFGKLPVGPIGIHLDIKDSKWAAAVEFAIGSPLLNSFCVDNHQDSALLRGILKRYYARPPSIIVSPFEPKMFDVQHGKVQSHFPSVLDMLTIKNHLVANCLIDQAQIEKKVLVENENDGVNLMNNPPRNCSSAYLRNCDQICFNPSRMYSYGKRTPRTRLTDLGKDVVKKLEKDKEEKAARIKEIRKTKDTMMNALESIPAKLGGLENEYLKLTTDYKRNMMEIEELERREETKNVDCLQEDLETLCCSCEQKKEEIKRCYQVVSQLEAKIVDLHKQKDTQSALLKSLNENYQRLLMKIGDVSKLKESFATGKRKYELELRCKENACINQQKVLEDNKEKLEIARSRAVSICQRINTDKSTNELARLIKETEKVVIERSNCDRESLRKKYQEKLENLHRALADRKKLEDVLNKIGKMIENRNANFNIIRKNTELVIGLAFTTIIGGNGYKGHLLFNHNERTLSMKASPRAGEGTRKNHSSLSGGERSFVTIAFLLALWERTKMPFRILDEYDVFMDSSNRQLCFDLLCKKGVEMSKTQFILLSPLDLPKMTNSDCVHILKLAAPKRKAEDDENSPRKKRS